MAQTRIEDRTFINDNGDVVKYKRLVIRGVLQGEVQSVEVRVDKNEAMMINMLLNSTEEENTASISHQPYVSNSKNANLIDEAEKALKEEEEAKTKEDFQSGFSI